MGQSSFVSLTDIIAPAYYDCFWDIKDGKHTYYDLYGGRGSLKSSFASVMIVLGIMEDFNNGAHTNAVIFRKYGITLRDSVYEQITWAIEMLGCESQWIFRTSPLQIIYRPSGTKIIFRGLDKAKKTKSIKASRGYFKYLWFEELDEFTGEEEVRMTQQSVLRGGEDFIVFKTFNPPISRTNWANMHVEKPRDDAYRLKVNYTQVPAEWLGPQFIQDAEYLKQSNLRAYEHEFLGLPVGIGTNVFELLEVRTITDEEIAQQTSIYQGQDWGWYPDPKAFVRVSYIPSKQSIMILDELGGCKIKNSDLANTIKELGYDDYPIYCGVDEQESIVDYRDCGLVARPAVMHNGRRGGSRKYMYEWLQCRTIIVDPNRTPNIYKELTEYEHEVDPNGEVIADYPDGSDHWLDALRYSTSPVSMRRGEQA